MFLDVLKDTEEFPHGRAAAALTDQVIRAIGSIGANISEGFNRSQKKFLNSLDIAIGEAHESENWIYKLRDAGFMDREKANTHVRECIEISKMINGLIKSIRRRNDSDD